MQPETGNLQVEEEESQLDHKLGAAEEAPQLGAAEEAPQLGAAEEVGHKRAAEEDPERGRNKRAAPVIIVIDD